MTTDLTPQAVLETALKHLDDYAKDRGIENGWLYEMDTNSDYYKGLAQPEDPRYPLTNDPSVVGLYSAVNPIRGLIRLVLETYDWTNRGPSALEAKVLEIARAINDYPMTEDEQNERT